MNQPAPTANTAPTSKDARVMAVPGGCRWNRTIETREPSKSVGCRDLEPAKEDPR